MTTPSAVCCARCHRDDCPLVQADTGSLCLGCAEELGEAAGVDVEALAVLRVLRAAGERRKAPDTG